VEVGEKAEEYIGRSGDWGIGVVKEAICLSFKPTKLLIHTGHQLLYMYALSHRQ